MKVVVIRDYKFNPPAGAVLLYENDAGLYLFKGEEGFAEAERTPSRFHLDAAAMLEGDTDDWTLERITPADILGEVLIAAYHDGTLYLLTNGHADFCAQSMGREYLGLRDGAYPPEEGEYALDQVKDLFDWA